jgi:DNA-binding transcriptional regulator PaaX
MGTKSVTASFRANWRLTAQEAAHAMPVLQSVHPGLRGAPAPRLSTIRHLAQRWHIRDGTLRTALSRAGSTGTLEVADGRYRLGPVSLEEAAAAKALLTRTRGYTLGVVLDGERGDPPRLRKLFARLGFRPLQRSVWVGARTADDRLGTALRRAGLGGSVVVFQSDEVDADARARLSKLWRLAERAAELRRFHRQLIDYVTAPRISTREAAWRCVEAAPVWYRVAVHDEPPFPLAICGDDYPLQRLNADWRGHLTSMTRELVDLYRSGEQ